MKTSSRNKLGLALRALQRLTVEDLSGIDAAIIQSAASSVSRELALADESDRRGQLDQLTSEEHQICQSGRKIHAIKAVRERTNLGFADAKNLVEKFYPQIQRGF